MPTMDGTIFGDGQPCYGCAVDHPSGFHLSFEREGDAMITRFTPRPADQGPPGIMHGGLVTTLADEIAAWTVIGLRERFGFTAAIEARLQAPVRVGVEVVGRGTIAEEKPRILKIAVALTQQDKTAFRGTFTFVLLDERGAEKLLGGPIPASWKRFAR